MPQNPNLIATKTVSGDVYIFDRTKHASDPSPDGVCRPDIKLKGQKKEGYGLSWSTLKQGHVLSASDDTTVCHWDVGGYQKGKQTMDPLKVYRGHSAVVEVSRGADSLRSRLIRAAPGRRLARCGREPVCVGWR